MCAQGLRDIGKPVTRYLTGLSRQSGVSLHFFSLLTRFIPGLASAIVPFSSEVFCSNIVVLCATTSSVRLLERRPPETTHPLFRYRFSLPHARHVTHILLSMTCAMALAFSWQPVPIY